MLGPKLDTIARIAPVTWNSALTSTAAIPIAQEKMNAIARNVAIAAAVVARPFIIDALLCGSGTRLSAVARLVMSAPSQVTQWAF
ncbi:MAG: hypothetical protein ACRC7G_15580 [Beijerinckiaceae bacterium]